MPYMFRSDFPIIIKQIHLNVDDHHGPHHETVMVRKLCIAIDENRFAVFGRILLHCINIYEIAFVHGVP